VIGLRRSDAVAQRIAEIGGAVRCRNLTVIMCMQIKLCGLTLRVHGSECVMLIGSRVIG